MSWGHCCHAFQAVVGWNNRHICELMSCACMQALARAHANATQHCVASVARAACADGDLTGGWNCVHEHKGWPSAPSRGHAGGHRTWQCCTQGGCWQYCRTVRGAFHELYHRKD
jgi:hypothetical protein